MRLSFYYLKFIFFYFIVFNRQNKNNINNNEFLVHDHKLVSAFFGLLYLPYSDFKVLALYYLFKY